MNEFFSESLYFGIVVSLLAYWVGYQIQKKWKFALFNPLLISMFLIIAFLMITHIDFETYQYGAKYITYFLTPVTVCLAIPLYKQFTVLKENFAAIIISISIGCLAHAAIVIGVLEFYHIDRALLLSLLPKSITTAIALGVTSEIGGIQAVTVIGVCIAGLSGSIFGPTILYYLKIREPVAQGLAIGSASHAIGTSKAIEMGEIQAAMSSLAIVVTGLLTVIIVPIVVQFI